MKCMVEGFNKATGPMDRPDLAEPNTEFHSRRSPTRKQRTLSGTYLPVRVTRAGPELAWRARAMYSMKYEEGAQWKSK